MIGSGTMATGSACLLSLITLPTRAANVESGAMMMSAATSPRVQAIPGRLTFMATATYGKSASTPRSWLATGAPRLCRAPLARLFATYPTASLPAPGPGKSLGSFRPSLPTCLVRANAFHARRRVFFSLQQIENF